LPLGSRAKARRNVVTRRARGDVSRLGMINRTRSIAVPRLQ
jgi:hypothetical protein